MEIARKNHALFNLKTCDFRPKHSKNHTFSVWFKWWTIQDSNL